MMYFTCTRCITGLSYIWNISFEIITYEPKKLHLHPFHISRFSFTYQSHLEPEKVSTDRSTSFVYALHRSSYVFFFPSKIYTDGRSAVWSQIDSVVEVSTNVRWIKVINVKVGHLNILCPQFIIIRFWFVFWSSFQSPEYPVLKNKHRLLWSNNLRAIFDFSLIRIIMNVSNMLRMSQ